MPSFQLAARPGERGGQAGLETRGPAGRGGARSGKGYGSAFALSCPIRNRITGSWESILASPTGRRRHLRANPPAGSDKSGGGLLAHNLARARLPHLWVRSGRERLSLLDLPKGESFLLLTHPAGHQRWRDAVSPAERYFLSIWRVCLSARRIIGSDRRRMGLATFIGNRRHGRRPGFRPDGHVAWRCSKAPVDPLGSLIEVMKRIRCHGGNAHLPVLIASR